MHKGIETYDRAFNQALDRAEWKNQFGKTVADVAEFFGLGNKKAVAKREKEKRKARSYSASEMTLDEARETDRLIKRHINTTRYLLLDMRDRKGWKRRWGMSRLWVWGEGAEFRFNPPLPTGGGG